MLLFSFTTSIFWFESMPLFAFKYPSGHIGLMAVAAQGVVAFLVNSSLAVGSIPLLQNLLAYAITMVIMSCVPTWHREG